MPDRLQYPAWQTPYLAAMLEMNSANIKAKIVDAKTAIQLRIVSHSAAPEERQAILDALSALKFLNR
jgi:hypothetical protein